LALAAQRKPQVARAITVVPHLLLVLTQLAVGVAAVAAVHPKQVVTAVLAVVEQQILAVVLAHPALVMRVVIHP
jgi:hypothetical protein